MRRDRSIAACLLLTIAGVSAAATINIPATTRGTFRQNGLHVGTNPNYVAGGSNDIVNRNYFVFDLSGITLPPGQTVSAAGLSLKSWAVFTPGPSETVTFYDLSTPRSTLEFDTPENSPAGLAAFADAGSGTIYGTQDYVDADDDTIKLVPLNAAALSAITSALGSGDFMIGGAVTTLDGLDNLEFVYGISQSPDPVPTLVLTTIPEPHVTTTAVLAVVAYLRLRRQPV